jgi:hypothetical protein
MLLATTEEYMRTVSKNHLRRLVAQKTEADTLKLTKTATALNGQINKLAARDDNDFYSYSFDEMQQNVEDALWDAAIRAQDYYGATVDASDIQKIIEDYAERLIEDVRIKTGAVIGAYEPTVPGEVKAHTTIEVSEEN